MLTSKQQILVDYAIKNNGQIQSCEANKLLQHYFYANHKKYVGLILSRLVAVGILNRQKPGVFAINTTSRKLKKAGEVDIQTRLWG